MGFWKVSARAFALDSEQHMGRISEWRLTVPSRTKGLFADLRFGAPGFGSHEPDLGNPAGSCRYGAGFLGFRGAGERGWVDISHGRSIVCRGLRSSKLHASSAKEVVAHGI